MTISNNPALAAASTDETTVTLPEESDAEMASRLQIQYAVAVDIPSDNKTKFPTTEHSSQNYITTSTRNETVADATNTYALPPGHNHTSLPGVYAVPIQYSTAPNGGPAVAGVGANSPPVILQSEQTLKMMRIQSLGRGMRTLALIDGFFLFLNAMYYPIVLVLVWGPYMGYKGAKEFQANPIKIYAVYRMLRIVGDIITFIVYGISNIAIFSFLVDLFVFHYANKFLSALKTLNEGEIAQLQAGILIGQGRQAFYSY